MANGGNDAVIRVRDLVVGFEGAPVLDRLSLDVFRGEILGFVGASGAGKSVLMRTVIGLVPKRAGLIEVFGVVLGAHGAPERPVPDARISQAVAPPARRGRARQARNGRAHLRRVRQISLRA